MGSPLSPFPDPPARDLPVPHGSFASSLPPPPERPELVFGDPGEFWRREPKRRYIILFLLTLLTTTLVGALNDEAFIRVLERPTWGSVLLALPHGFWYSLPVLAILGAHEFGHYLACVYYRVNASLPYFLPLPLPPSGTLGAVIRIRQPIPGKRALFDIGIAGPIAGFVMLIPFLVLGIGMSNIGTIPTALRDNVAVYGDPLLLKLVARVMLGPIGDNQTIFIHPMGFAAWWGMLATALNLFPIGQLDGGHITYAIFGRRSTTITLAAVGVLVALAIFVSRSWIVWTVVTVGMLASFGPRHPRVFDEEVPLDRGRKYLALFALVMFILCFTPTPIDLGGVFGQ
jgi:membrane-associated protease RseP (regulator of RpoE activity)